MKALVYDTTKGGWEQTRGFWMEEMPEPKLEAGDDEMVILKMRYAGFCGSDRGMWSRSSFGELIQTSLAKENKTRRIIGHELLGEVVQMGSAVANNYKIKIGDIVTAESHITCGKCYQCLAGDKHVCADDIIIGISQDGCFAHYAKLPAKILWPTDINKIDPRIAAIQEPLGNAVHACMQTDLNGKSVAVFGCGAIGSLSIMIAKALGARQVIAVGVKQSELDLAKAVGADEVIKLELNNNDKPFASDPQIIAKIKELTGGVGVDVGMEMAGPNSSVNNVIKSVRRGGHAVFFGLKAGDFIIEDFERVIRNGLQMHCVIGRQIWATWELIDKLMADTNNGLQEKIKKYVLADYNGSIVKFDEFTPEMFEEKLKNFTKLVFEF